MGIKVNISQLNRVKLILAGGALLLTATQSALANPSIDNLVINPPPIDNWIVASTTGAIGVTTVSIDFDAKDPAATCFDLNVGWMAKGRCQQTSGIFPRPVWPNGIGMTRSYTPNCYKTVSPPDTIAKLSMDFDVARNANGATLSLCASILSTNQQTTKDFRLSHGEPVKAVKVAMANYSMGLGRLRTKGTVTPKGNTKLNGSIVHIYDSAGLELGTGTVKGKSYDVTLMVENMPTGVTVRVVNTKSATRKVQSVR